MTLYKAQGATVNKSFYLASPHDSRNLSYVGMTRHRESVQVFGSLEEFSHLQGFVKSLSQDKEKLLVADYVKDPYALTALYRADQTILSRILNTTSNHLAALTFVGREKVLDLKERLGFYPEREVKSILTDQSEHTFQGRYDTRESFRAREVLGLSRSRDLSAYRSKDCLPDLPETSSVSEASSFSQERYDFDILHDGLRNSARTVAYHILGPPHIKLSTQRELRYGSKGSLCITIEGERRGQWYDFERAEGGHLFKLIQQTQGTDLKSTLKLADNLIVGRSALLPETKKTNEPNKKPNEERQEKVLRAQSLYKKTQPCTKGSSASGYLNHRGIHVDPGEDIRQGHAYDHGRMYDALICFARNARGEVTGGQKIYVEGSGTENSDIHPPTLSPTLSSTPTTLTPPHTLLHKQTLFWRDTWVFCGCSV